MFLPHLLLSLAVISPSFLLSLVIRGLNYTLSLSGSDFRVWGAEIPEVYIAISHGHNHYQPLFTPLYCIVSLIQNALVDACSASCNGVSPFLMDLVSDVSIMSMWPLFYGAFFIFWVPDVFHLWF